MALFLGKDKVNLKIENISRILNLNIAIPSASGLLLKSKEGLTLRDNNEIQIFARKE